MTDQMIPADKVRKIASAMRAAMRRDDSMYHEGEFLSDMSDYIRDLDKLCARARPRLEWPDGTTTWPDHLAVGTVIESADDPRLAALPDGSVLSDCDGDNVAKRAEAWAGIGYIPIASERDEFGPWTVRRIGWEADQ